MKAATHERLRRTAVEAVSSIPGIEAVVLYGSRARGTARAASDWDIAILSHASRDNEHAARRLFGEFDPVHPIVVNPESIEAHCNQGIRIENAIARQGQLLAGEWIPPRCRCENLDVTAEDIGDNLDIATRDVCSAFLALRDAAFKGQSYIPNVVEYSQQASEPERRLRLFPCGARGNRKPAPAHARCPMSCGHRAASEKADPRQRTPVHLIPPNRWATIPSVRASPRTGPGLPVHTRQGRTA